MKTVLILQETLIGVKTAIVTSHDDTENMHMEFIRIKWQKLLGLFGESMKVK